jgi:hypothetical protein
VDQREVNLRSKLRRDHEYGRGCGVVYLTTSIAREMISLKLHVPILPFATTARRMGTNPWHV